MQGNPKTVGIKPSQCRIDPACVALKRRRYNQKLTSNALSTTKYDQKMDALGIILSAELCVAGPCLTCSFMGHEQLNMRIELSTTPAITCRGWIDACLTVIERAQSACYDRMRIKVPRDACYALRVITHDFSVWCATGNVEGDNVKNNLDLLVRIKMLSMHPIDWELALV